MLIFDDPNLVTMGQKYFLSVCGALEIQEEKLFTAKFDALCKANGVKIPENSNGSDFRSRMLLKQQENMEQ